LHRPRRSRSVQATALAVALLTLAGCGHGDRPDLGQVHGTVTLNGKPLAGAQVVFRPRAGHISCAMTDANGSYDLVYIRRDHGALLGKHRVQISTLLPEMSRKEVVPACYNSRTILEREVAAGKNAIDFDLK